MVALGRTLQDAAVAGRAMRARCHELRVAVSEDRPEPADLALLSHMEDVVEDLAGAATEAANAVTAAASLYDESRDREGGRQLVACHLLVNKLGRQLDRNLAGHEPMTELEALARQRGRAWVAWLVAVRRSVEEGRRAVDLVEDALVECWRDVADLRPNLRTTGPVARAKVGLKLLGNEEGEEHDGTK
jgi:hypothetical protein